MRRTGDLEGVALNIIGILVVLGAIIIFWTIARFALRLGCFLLVLSVIALIVYLTATGNLGRVYEFFKSNKEAVVSSR